jgi:zinc transporter ZupT
MNKPEDQPTQECCSDENCYEEHKVEETRRLPLWWIIRTRRTLLKIILIQEAILSWSQQEAGTTIKIEKKLKNVKRKIKLSLLLLLSMNMNTATAIGLHNKPEGLATSVGAVLLLVDFAIVVHNVPEGLCVALPIYSTGNQWQVFGWALVLSGASEFIAAHLGWDVLANLLSDTL